MLKESLEGKRIGPAEGLSLFREADLTSLGYVADERRMKVSPGNSASYGITTNINYTNVCVSGCKFCAFYRSEDDPEAFTLTNEEILAKIQHSWEQGCKHLLLQGGLHPKLGLDYFCRLLREIKGHYAIHIHAFSPPEIIHLSRMEGLKTEEILQALIGAGLDSMPGGGAEILAQGARAKLSPHKCSAEEWLAVMAVAHGLGLPTTATMMFGHVESIEDRLEHLLRLRQLQDKTGGFTAFIPWPFQPGNSQLNSEPTTGVDYLRTVAISRIILDNITNIHASILTQGFKIAQLALHFGANDIGEVMLEENVLHSTGRYHSLSQEEIVRLIADAGFTPVLRKPVAYRRL